ncbi:MAG: hypothetical protein VX498_01925 [Myxococcota bacterium]|nr:hypothetical protein [Myxococcota bacterium]
MRRNLALILISSCALLWPALSGAQTLGQQLERLVNPGPPLGPEVDSVFNQHRVNGLSFGEYLHSLDFAACLTTVQDDLVAGLDRLRGLHVVSQENRGLPSTWRVWNRKLDGLSPDALVLVSTWLDSPETARRLFFCEDGLPASWKRLDADSYVVEAITWFDVEVADREHALQQGNPGDREQSVMALMELRAALLGRFDTTYPQEAQALAARDRLQERLELMWQQLVEPFHYGFTPRARTTLPLTDPTASYQPSSPFGSSGIGIPDPRDVALRDRVAASWRAQGRTIDREIEDRQLRLDELVALIGAGGSPADLDRLVRQAFRLDAELAQSVADLERMQSRVRLLSTGRPWVDSMLGNGYRRRAVRRLDRRQKGVLAQRDDVTRVIEQAVAQGAQPPETLFNPSISAPTGGLAAASPGEPGPGNWLEGLPTSEAGFPTQDPEVDPLAEGSGWVERVYEGPLPPPSKVWSEELVEAIAKRHSRLDATDIRILLGLVRATYDELPGRAAVEEAVWRTLASAEGLSIGGEESTLSELYLPGESRSEQPIITFVLTLKF